MDRPLNPFSYDQTWTPVRLSSTFSLPERVGKQIRHVLLWCILAIRHRGKPPVFIAWPDLPSKRSVLHKICRELGWELTNQPRKNVQGVMRFEDATEKSLPLPAWIQHAQVPILNKQCVDIRKQTLERHHVTAFGYGMQVNPLAHEGFLVIKSDTNAQHDGRIVQGPLPQGSVHDTHVYQRVIRNQDTAERWLDLRVVWINGILPHLYLKFKHEDERFTNLTAEVKLATVSDWLAPQEIEHISNLMELHQTEAAELDVLRDADDGRIYVVDINPTPWGPPEQLDRTHAQTAIHQMAKKLRQAVVTK
jgi:hypothetical protein